MGTENGQINGHDLGAHDFISGFLSYTSTLSSPYIHRLWAAIATVSGALERRVWTEGGNGLTYPNLFVLLVGPPGTGKSLPISRSELLWRSYPGFKLASHSVTKASLVDELAAAKRVYTLPNKEEVFEYSCLLIAVDEFGVFMRGTFDSDFAATLARLWDNHPDHKERRRTGNVQELVIINPTITMLSGAQPDFLTSILPELAWGQGFTSRFIMAYSDEEIHRPIFAPYSDPKSDYRYTKLASQVESFARLYGQFQWHQEVVKRLEAWDLAGGEPKPTHSRLAHWNRRRTQHIVKFCMISCASRSGFPWIELVDFNRAFEWLDSIETELPSIFRAMTGGPDKNIITELTYFVQSECLRLGNSVHERELRHFLVSRAPVERIDKILENVEKSGMLSRSGMHYSKPEKKDVK